MSSVLFRGIGAILGMLIGLLVYSLVVKNPDPSWYLPSLVKGPFVGLGFMFGVLIDKIEDIRQSIKAIMEGKEKP